MAQAKQKSTTALPHAAFPPNARPALPEDHPVFRAWDLIGDQEKAVVRAKDFAHALSLMGAADIGTHPDDDSAFMRVTHAIIEALEEAEERRGEAWSALWPTVFGRPAPDHKTEEAA